MAASLIDAIQRRVAVASIGPSTARGQGAPGVVRAIRQYLSTLSLQRFATKDGQTFLSELNSVTDELERCLPKKARSWGLARKCTNIFLRDAFYNHYLREHYGLAATEKWHEIPLDGIVAKALRKKAKLPRWKGVKKLKQPISEDYQHAAADLAAKKGIARVHLDAYLFVSDRNL